MFKNDVVVSGFSGRVNEMTNDKTGAVQGYYFHLAQIGCSIPVYARQDCIGAEKLKEGGFYEVLGALKPRSVGNGLGLTAVKIEEKENPMNHGKK